MRGQERQGKGARKENLLSPESLRPGEEIVFINDSSEHAFSGAKFYFAAQDLENKEFYTDMDTKSLEVVRKGDLDAQVAAAKQQRVDRVISDQKSMRSDSFARESYAHSQATHKTPREAWNNPDIRLFPGAVVQVVAIQEGEGQSPIMQGEVVVKLKRGKAKLNPGHFDRSEEFAVTSVDDLETINSVPAQEFLASHYLIVKNFQLADFAQHNENSPGLVQRVVNLLKRKSKQNS